MTYAEALQEAIDAKIRQLDSLNRMTYRNVTMEGIQEVPRPREFVVRFTEKYTEQRQRLEALMPWAEWLDSCER